MSDETRQPDESIREVTRFQTSDGLVHATYADAQEHQFRIMMMDAWTGFPRGCQDAAADIADALLGPYQGARRKLREALDYLDEIRPLP